MTAGARGTAALALLGGLMLAPFVWLALFVAPQMDDFCYGVLLMARGWWGGFAQLSETLHGRYTTHLLIMLPTALFRGLGIDWFAVLDALALLLLAGLALLSHGLLRLLMPEAGRTRRGALALVLTAALVANARSIRDLLYWWPASVTYTLPALLLGGAYLCLLRAVLRGERTGGPGAAAAGAALVVAAWCNEFTAGIAMALVAGSWAARRWGGHPARQTGLHLLWLGLAAGAFALLLLAPGSSARMEQPLLASDLLPAAIGAVPYFLEFVALVLAGPGALGWLALAALLLPGLQPGGRRPPAALMLLPASLVLGGFALFLVAYVAYRGGPPARLQNEAFVLALLAMTTLVALWRRRRPRRPAPRWAAAAAAAVVLASPGFLVALPQLAEAPAFRAAYRERIAALEAGRGGTVSVAPLPAAPPFLHQGDIGGPETSPQCVADYFGVAELLTPAPFPRATGFAPYWFEWASDWARSAAGRRNQ